MKNLIKEVLGIIVSFGIVIGFVSFILYLFGYEKIEYDANTIESILILCSVIFCTNFVNKYLNVTDDIVDYIQEKILKK